MNRRNPKGGAAGGTKVGNKASGLTQAPKSKVVDKEGNDPDADQDEGGGGGGDDDDAILAFFQDLKQEARSDHIIRKVSGYQALDIIRVGPDFIDDEYNECTPVPLWLKDHQIYNYDVFLERADDEIITITPIKPQTFSALFQFYKDRTPGLNWDPNLTDLEEDCFYQDLLAWPSKKLTHSRPIESKKEPIPKKRVKVFKPSGDYIYKTRLTISLTETSTTMLFEINGNMVLNTDPKNEGIAARNKKYWEIVKDHEVSDTYVNDYAQTYGNYSLSKYTDYKIRGCADAGTQVHTYVIKDEYVKVAAEDEKRRILEQDEAAARILAEKARLEIPDMGWKDSDSDDSDEEKPGAQELDVRADISKYKDDDEDAHREKIMDEASDDDIPITDDDEQEFEIKQRLDMYYKNKKLIELKKPPRNYPDISFSLIAMERIICMDSQQLRQADMRQLIDPAEWEKAAQRQIIHIEEEEQKEEEIDEDEMVSLLIEQQRMQEQLENGEGGDGMANIIMPDLDDFQSKKEEDEDDDLLAEANEQEQEEIRRQEQLRLEREAAEKAAEEAAAIAAALAARENEPDEFDIAVNELKQAAKEGEDITSRLAQQQSQLTADAEGQSDAGGLTAATATEVSSAPEQVTETGLEEDQKESASVTDSSKPPEVKTLVPPTPKPVVGVASVTPSQGGFMGIAGTDLSCAWTENDEKIDDAKAQEAELAAGVPDVIDDAPLKLRQYVQDEPLSDDETDFGAKKQIEVSGMLDDEEGGGCEAAAAEGAVVKLTVGDDDGEKTEEKKVVEVMEYDDISSDETHHENSIYSDHVELSEDASTDSDSSIKNPKIVLTTKEPRVYSEWSQEPPQDNETLPPMQQGPHLRQYWTFKCRETQGLEVTDITHHPSNENIIAASYGSINFGDHREGLVCIWNAKNNRSPERMYKLRAPGTSLAFSELTPFVLAVGMLDGNVVLFDLREDDALILGATISQKINYGHIGPIWQVYFLIEVDSSNEDVVIESMLTLGDDGLLKRWTIQKGLESQIVMKVGRSTIQVPGRREKRSESLITSLSIAYTVCFFPKNCDFFLLGTEEGFIHKCSTSYKESFLGTFVGHTGPVYKVAFSEFDETIFFSCGGDWTVKLWKLESPMPLLSLQTGHRTIFDVTCSRFLSTVFICATGFHVEVWDLSANTLEPTVRYNPPFSEGQRKVAFNGLLNSVIVGDDEGALSIYGLRNFPQPPPTKEAQKELLLESLLPGYKRQKEAAEAELQRRRDMESTVPE